MRKLMHTHFSKNASVIVYSKEKWLEKCRKISIEKDLITFIYIEKYKL